MLNKELAEFVRDLRSYGMYVLPCGGGVVNEPRRAIRKMGRTYGTARLVRLSMELVFEIPSEEVRPVETVPIALGILYHLADAELLTRLIATRATWVAAEADPTHEGPAMPIAWIDTLISGVCGRLGHSYPDGIEPLHPLEEHALFLDHSGFD